MGARRVKWRSTRRLVVGRLSPWGRRPRWEWAIALAIVLATAPAYAQSTETATTGAAWREGLWRETAVLNETLLLRCERRLEHEKDTHGRDLRALRLAEQLAESTPVRVERVGPSPLAWIAVGAAVVGAFVGGVFLSRSIFVGKAVTQ